MSDAFEELKETLDDAVDSRIISRPYADKLYTELLKWRQALQSLTPGGSEFTEPHECVRFVRDRDTERWELLKKMKRERDDADKSKIF